MLVRGNAVALGWNRRGICGKTRRRACILLVPPSAKPGVLAYPVILLVARLASFIAVVDAQEVRFTTVPRPIGK